MLLPREIPREPKSGHGGNSCGNNRNSGSYCRYPGVDIVPKGCLNLVSDAYLLLLQVPATDVLRALNQHVYADLRSYIAAQTGRTDEEVQTTYEEIANVLRESIEWKRRQGHRNSRPN